MHWFAKCTWVVATLLILSATPSKADESAVEKTITDYVLAFNANDLAKLGAMWAPNAVYVDRTISEVTEGREAILKDLGEVFASGANVKLAGAVETIRMVTPSVAKVSGTCSLTTGGSDPSMTNFTAILVQQGNAWVIDSLEETAIQQPASAAAALEPLNWLIGDWVDASGESAVKIKVRSAIGGAFLVRTFEMVDSEGQTQQSTQIIGYDPRAIEIRSWSFSSDGSFGDGVWSFVNDQWLVKSTQTLADGQAATGTYVMTLKDNDSFTVQLIGRDIEGEPQPASEVISVKRASVASPGTTSTSTGVR